MINPNEIPFPWPLRIDNKIQLTDKVVELGVVMNYPKAIVVHDFLSDEECTQLIALSISRLSPSNVINIDDGSIHKHEARTSNGMFYKRGETPLIEKIESRIAEFTCWPVVFGEGLQVLRYEPGQEYKPHDDYFDPILPGSASRMVNGGQRVATMLLYLNNPISGGATIFSQTNAIVAARKGSALLFAYPLASKEDFARHGGMPVMDGVKYVATKWFRQDYLPS